MRILYVTTISLTVNCFFKPHIEMLVRAGHKVDIACNAENLPLDRFYTELGCDFYQVDFSRSPLSLNNIRACGQFKKVVENGKYDIVHCHTPNASVITRFVCRKFRKKNGLKVFYTAHGFHFYKGAPKLNWMVYYPIEKICSRFTDKLITINKEDYALAQKKFKARGVYYIPGVGIDFSKFESTEVNRTAKRREIGVPENAVLLISVGELSVRKNHMIILRALAEINNDNIHFVVVGTGKMLSSLRSFTVKHGIEQQVHFLGYRKDVVALYKASDICCLPSIHEGLPVALMEAMACEKPCLVSEIRGSTDLIDDNGGVTFNPLSVESAKKAIGLITDRADALSMGKYNFTKVKMFSTKNVVEELGRLYFEIDRA